MDSATEGDDDEGLGLSFAQLSGIVALLLAIFLFAGGPIWQHPFEVDVAAIASYLPIPLFVAVCLLWSKRFSARRLFVNTIILGCTKFGITYTIAIALWAASSGPPAPKPSLPPPAKAQTNSTPGPQRVPDGPAAVEGRVLDPQGHPARGAVVYLEGPFPKDYAPRGDSIEIVNRGTVLVPDLIIGQVGQKLVAHSEDPRLHTLVATTSQAPVFNIPLLRSGTTNSVTIPELNEPVLLECNAHKGQEQSAELIVVSHPFFARTDDDARFHIEHVPSGPVKVIARTRGERAELSVDVATTTKASVELTLQR